MVGSRYGIGTSNVGARDLSPPGSRRAISLVLLRLQVRRGMAHSADPFPAASYPPPPLVVTASPTVDWIRGHDIDNQIIPLALTRAFKSLAQRAGVPERKLHALRHLHASALFDQGESPMLVSRRLGHASIKTTVDIYGHLFEGQQKRAAEAFGKAMRAES